MANQDSSLDRISNLPSFIIENILCLVPLKEAVRTSILSKDWRYSWTKIPKLVFTETDMLDKTCDVFLDVILQVLSLHRGPILEVSLSMVRSVYNHVELEPIISHLASNNNTVKKFTLRGLSDKLPLSTSLLHQLTDLYISDCVVDDDLKLSGFGSLTSLYVQGEILSKNAILHSLSGCPLLKHFELAPGFWGCDRMVPIIELFKCLPVIEHLTLFTGNIKCDRVPGKLPSAFVHLKYFCLKDMHLFDDFGLRHLCFVIRNSPNLEKIKLEIGDSSSVDDVGKQFCTLKDSSDIWLAHLKELEIVGFTCQKAEMEFVKLIFAKSPVLMKVKIILNNQVTMNEELEIKRIMSGFPCVSPLAEMIVEPQRISEYAFILEGQRIATSFFI